MEQIIPLAEVDAGQFGDMAKMVLFGYLLVLLVIGYLGYRRSIASEVDYYLAGRGQGWVVSSLTIMATFFSSFALLGIPGQVYREGVVLALFALNVPVAGGAIYVLGSRIARLGRARGCVTPADLMGDYYTSPVGIPLLLALTGFLYAVPYVVMQIHAGGLISQVMFPEAEHAFEYGAVALAMTTMVYIMVGGMRSVGWTDVIQGGLLLGGMLLAGLATVWAMGGLGGFFEQVATLPSRSLSAPGTTGAWTAGRLFTATIFVALGSMVQPAQWMRFYAARSTNTLRRSALIFGTVLTLGYLIGVMLVGLGGQALYPIIDQAGNYLTNEAGQLIPHPAVGSQPQDFDKILVVVLKQILPALMGTLGLFIAALVVVAIMAAAMSTADSNLHALSAVITRDVYGRFLRPQASQRERAWVGRGIIAAATILALTLIFVGRASTHFNPLAMIAQMAFLAISFSTQLLPATVDMLFIRRGTRAGAMAGLAVGLLTVFLFTPFFSMIVGVLGGEGQGAMTALDSVRKVIDLGAFGLIGNVTVFVVVSAFTRPVDPEHARKFKTDAEPSSAH